MLKLKTNTQQILKKIKNPHILRKKVKGVRTRLSYDKVFHGKCSNRNEKTEIFVNKPVYLRHSILELSKVLMFEFWYDYLNPKS